MCIIAQPSVSPNIGRDLYHKIAARPFTVAHILRGSGSLRQYTEIMNSCLPHFAIRRTNNRKALTPEIMGTVIMVNAQI